MMTLKDTDQSGRPKPVEISKTEFVLAFDTIIPAVGQELAIDFVDHDLLKTNPGSYQTQIEKVFIGGDALRGASTAINAIGDGRKAAVEILRKTKFEGKEYFITKEKQVDIQQLKIRKATRQFAIKPIETPADMRRNFNLLTATLKRDEAVKEASRCLQCDVICNVCVSVCPNHANFGYEVQKNPMRVIKVKVKGGQVKTSESKTFSVSQKYQVLNIADWCNECGNCDTFCPSAGAPYKDKPRLFLNNESFAKSPDGYLLKDEGDGNKIISMKTKNSSATLTENWDAYIFENDYCMIVLDKNTLSIQQFEWMGDDDYEIEIPEIPQMKILLDATRNLI
jgi:putative selenate reductase